MLNKKLVAEDFRSSNDKVIEKINQIYISGLKTCNPIIIKRSEISTALKIKTGLIKSVKEITANELAVSEINYILESKLVTGKSEFIELVGKLDLDVSVYRDRMSYMMYLNNFIEHVNISDREIAEFPNLLEELESHLFWHTDNSEEIAEYAYFIARAIQKGLICADRQIYNYIQKTGAVNVSYLMIELAAGRISSQNILAEYRRLPLNDLKNIKVFYCYILPLAISIGKITSSTELAEYFEMKRINVIRYYLKNAFEEDGDITGVGLQDRYFDNILKIILRHAFPAVIKNGDELEEYLECFYYQYSKLHILYSALDKRVITNKQELSSLLELSKIADEDVKNYLFCRYLNIIPEGISFTEIDDQYQKVAKMHEKYVYTLIHSRAFAGKIIATPPEIKTLINEIKEEAEQVNFEDNEDFFPRLRIDLLNMAIRDGVITRISDLNEYLEELQPTCQNVNTYPELLDFYKALLNDIKIK